MSPELLKDSPEICSLSGSFFNPPKIHLKVPSYFSQEDFKRPRPQSKRALGSVAALAGELGSVGGEVGVKRKRPESGYSLGP